jgi:polyvinyl alcohol dehydrogenase (cytochrome)
MSKARLGFGVIGALALVWLGVSPPAVAQAPTSAGQQVWETRCKSCHEPPVERAPGRAQIAQRPAADIVTALTAGVMVPMAQGLSPDQIKAVADYITQPAPSAGQAAMPSEAARLLAVPTPVGSDPMCKVNNPIKAGVSDWPSVRLDDRSTAFQRKPGLTVADLPKLKLKWAFSMAGGGQPTVVGDYLFMANRSGVFYALDTKTGCVHWVQKGVVSRSSPPVARSTVAPSGWITFVGAANRIVHAYDAQTGQELWKSDSLESHPSSLLTGSPVLAGDVLLVPISSIEEASSMDKNYACCTFRGSLAALDARTGKTLWKTYTITEAAHPIGRTNASGKPLTGPAGAAVWSAPTVDKKRGLVYIVTGDSYTDVDQKGSDAAFAIEIKTGKVRWQHQVTEKDNFVMGCGPTGKTGNCPSPMGPDYDFGATPVLFDLPGGKQVLMAGQKSGIVYGFQPSNGKLLWKTQVGVGSALGGVEWGIGADDKRLYVPVADLVGLMMEARGAPSAGGPAGQKAGLYALDPATGKILWSAPAPVAPCKYGKAEYGVAGCIRAQSAAPAVIPGAVFSGTLDGWFRAYDSATGKVIWSYSTTAQSYDTVNGIKGQPGGGIDGMGPAIADGMVFTMSGFNGASRIGSNGVNVLLAFGKD